ELLASVCELLTPALHAEFVAWREWTSAADVALGDAGTTGTDSVAVADSLLGEPLTTPPTTCVMVPTTDQPRFVFAIGQLKEGRRLLSDDLATLEAIAVVVARRIDAI